MKIQEIVGEIKSHYPLLLTIIVTTMLFFWILPLAVSDLLMGQVLNFAWTIYDYMYIVIVIVLCCLRLVIIVEFRK